MNTRKQDSPSQAAAPLPVWLVATALLVALLLTLGMIHQHISRGSLMAFTKANEERLKAVQSAGDSPLVVALGNSLLRQATSPDRIADDVPWLRVTRHNNKDLLALWPMLEKSRPDILVIQLELLANGEVRPDEALPIDIVQWLHTAPDMLESLASWNDQQATLIAKHQGAQQRNQCLHINDWEIIAQKLGINKQVRYLPLATDEAMLAAIRKAAGFAGKIILIEIPRSAATEAFLDDAYTAWRNAQLAKLSDLPNARFHRLGEPLADDCYCDFRHITRDCQAIMQTRLYDILQGELLADAR